MGQQASRRGPPLVRRARKRRMAARAKALRASTCALLGLDVEKLTPADDVLVGRASALRLLVADLERAQLAGRAIDVAKYIEASAAVEDICAGHGGA